MTILIPLALYRHMQQQNLTPLQGVATYRGIKTISPVI